MKNDRGSLSRLNGLYTPFISHVPGGQHPKKGRRINCLSFLLEKFKPQTSNLKVAGLISFARLRTGASALYFPVYE